MHFGVKVDNGAKIPTKAHSTDAGFDLYAPFDFKVSPNKGLFIPSNVHILIEDGYTGIIKSKSSLNKLGLVCDGTVDAGYTGVIGVKFYNFGEDVIEIKKDQKMCQIVFFPIPEVELTQVVDFSETARGNGGFGSTGKF